MIDAIANFFGSSKTFVETLLSLVATAGLTGLLVPLVKGKMDDRKFREQKNFEAELARQAKLIESQVKFLENLSNLLWEYLYLAIQPSYYKACFPDPERFAVAIKNYDGQSWSIFGKFRAEVSLAQRLTSPETYRQLNDLYQSWVNDIDNWISGWEKKEFDSEGLQKLAGEHNKRLNDEHRKIDAILSRIANELQLSDGTKPKKIK
jgi:hypothetical protein